MEWIKFLTISKIKYHIYKLNKSDTLILHNLENVNNKIIIILYGLIYIVKVFPNKELLPIAILDKNTILINYKKDNQIYYKLVALETTYIISFKEDNPNHTINTELNNIKYYKKTLKRYEEMSEIISQRKTKNRIVQLILLIGLKFGIIRNQVILIPFKLSQENIAMMTGLSQNTINKTMKVIYKMGIIEENKRIINLSNILNINLK